MLGTVSKAGKVMELFTASSPEWGVSEVARAMVIPKSSAHALLTTLTDVGLVRRLPTGRYRLGWLLVSLNRTLLDTTDFVANKRPGLQILANRLSATIHLAALRGSDVIYLEKVFASEVANFTDTVVGSRAPAHCTALGKVLLAYSAPNEPKRIIERDGLARRTDRTITSWSRLNNELSQVRARGWGYDINETVRSLCCVAAPVWDSDGNVQAAISITLGADRFHQNAEALRRCLLSTAAELGRPVGTPVITADEGLAESPVRITG